MNHIVAPAGICQVKGYLARNVVFLGKPLGFLTPGLSARPLLIEVSEAPEAAINQILHDFADAASES
jgi:hypothetical protein